MLVDMKYHVATIVAVFMSLGIGMVLGHAIAGDDGLSESREEMIRRLDLGLSELRQQNRELKSEMAVLAAEAADGEKLENAVVRAIDAACSNGVVVDLVGIEKSMNAPVTRRFVETLGKAGVIVRSGRVVNIESLTEGALKELRKAVDRGPTGILEHMVSLGIVTELFESASDARPASGSRGKGAPTDASSAAPGETQKGSGPVAVGIVCSDGLSIEFGAQLAEILESAGVSVFEGIESSSVRLGIAARLAAGSTEWDEDQIMPPLRPVVEPGE